MPTLLEVQRAIRRSVLERDDAQAAPYVVPDGLPPEARLNVYRNTSIAVLTTALRLSYPAVHRLVGAAFFESAARIFIEADPPHSAWLDDYGGAFADFLARFSPAASLPYLSGVARLEWAVSRALHARDVDPVDLSRLAGIDPAEHRRIRFTPHLAIGLVQADYPVDVIWRAVLARDDAAMAAVDLGAGPVRLLVERGETSIEVTRLSESEWRFMAALCAAQPLQAAINAVPEADAAVLLAGHLAAGRFVGFEIIDDESAPEVSS